MTTQCRFIVQAPGALAAGFDHSHPGPLLKKLERHKYTGIGHFFTNTKSVDSIVYLQVSSLFCCLSQTIESVYYVSVMSYDMGNCSLSLKWLFEKKILVRRLDHTGELDRGDHTRFTA
jgi:hypothetical protein